MGAESDVRLGEAAIQHGIVSIDTLRQALNALLLERSSGLDRSLAHYLFEKGSINEEQFRFLVQFDPSAATIPLPRPAPPKPPPPRVGPPPLTKAPPLRRPPPMPDTQKASNQPFRPRRPIPSLVPGRLLTIAIGLVALGFGIWLAKRPDGGPARQDLVAQFDRSVQAARNACTKGDGRGAIDANRAAVDFADRCIADARDHQADSSRIRQKREEISALVERLQAAEEKVSAARRALDMASALGANGKAGEAGPYLNEALATIARYEGSAPSDDPFRQTMRQIRDSVESLKAQAQVAPPTPAATPPAAGNAYQRARDAYFDLGQRIAEALDASTAKTFEAEVAGMRGLLTETQKGMGADDSHRTEIDSWLDTLDTWDRRIAATAGAPARVAVRDEQYEQMKRAIDAALAFDPARNPSKAIEAIDLALDQVQYYESTAFADDPRLQALIAQADELLKRRRIAELSAGGGPPPTPGPAPGPVPDPAPAPHASLEELAKRVRPSVVLVKVVRKGTTEAVVVGSGFIVHKSGYVVTCRHLLDAALTIMVGWDARCGREDVEAKLVKWTLRSDLAVLKLPAGEYPALLLSAGNPVSGDPAVVFGCPAGGGAIEGTDGLLGDAGLTVGTERRLMATTLRLDPLGSGGVILDGMSVTAVAVALSAAEGPLAGHTYAIPAAVLRKEFPSLWGGTGYGAPVAAPDRGTGVGLPDTCRECRGKGAACTTCNGKGRVKANCSACCGHGFWEDSHLRQHPCPKCGGACTFDIQCPTCAGTGVVECRKCGAGWK